MIHRIPAALAAMLLTATLAPAAALDPFVGRWRIMASEPLPGAAPPPGDLQRFGVIVAASGVRGPEGFACAGPPEAAEVRPADAFQGVADRAFVARLVDSQGFPGNVIQTLRARCGAGTLELHLNGYDELFAAVGGSLHRLRRSPTEGWTEEAHLARLDAPFGCARASRPVERLICAFPGPLEAELDMAAAFERARERLTGARAEALRTTQERFAAMRVEYCAIDSGVLDDPLEVGGFADCATRVTRSRVGFLASLERRASGALAVEPSVSLAWRAGRAPRQARRPLWYAQDAVPVLLGAPPAATRAFEAEVRRRFGLDRPLQSRLTNATGGIDRAVLVGTLTSRFVSLWAVTVIPTDNEAPARAVTVNFDLQSGRPVGLDAVFERSAAWRAAVIGELRRDLMQEHLFDRRRDEILAGAPSVAWLFRPDSVTVAWTSPENIAEEVTIPAAVLAPFLTAGSPWQPQR